VRPGLAANGGLSFMHQFLPWLTVAGARRSGSLKLCEPVHCIARQRQQLRNPSQNLPSRFMSQRLYWTQETMSYELRTDRSLGKNLCRIFRKEIDGALAVANGETKADDTPVHALRKHLKKARAILHLVCEEIGHGHFRRQDHWLRNVGRLISGIRDAEVRLQTFRQLEHVTHRRRNGPCQKIETMLAFELENFAAAFAGWEKETVPLLERARGATKTWPIDDFDLKQLRRAVRSTYKSGRRALAAARANPCTANFHELRKQVKLLGYQLRILRPLNHVVVQNLSEELDNLGELLGRVRDLSFLGDRLRKEQNQTNWRTQDDGLLAVIDGSQAELQRDTAELGERFFAERPREFGSLVDAWFEDWQHANSSSVAEALIAT
jgi:CHAD domain-containing protein